MGSGKSSLLAAMFEEIEPKMNAIVDWLSREEGGRVVIPPGDRSPRYMPTIRLMDEPWPPEILWTAYVIKLGAIGGDRRWLAEVGYVFDDAPHEGLLADRSFELYEGPRCVARGVFVEAEASS